ncbi:MAG TPA: T9SS type A sorting domain-containing protein [bacterium]|nr:T9SS type A sorting domain-containing protein [bacterium]
MKQGMKKNAISIPAFIFLLTSIVLAGDDLPVRFDLRLSVDSRVTSVKAQTGGTCWAHAVMAAAESNLLTTGAWNIMEAGHEPNLAEYHLDWWNGFNMYHNADAGSGTGLQVHYGGDYLVAAAYMARGDGMVYCEAANDMTEYDANWYHAPPLQKDAAYVIYYNRSVAWLQTGPNLEHIGSLKRVLMEHGVIGTCIAYYSNYYQAASNTFYCSSDWLDPNHAVSIVGWDDEKVTQASHPGAWLIKNSWGSRWGQEGYFWVSYYDAHCGKHPEMGAVSYRYGEVLSFDRIYSWDYHGWRDTYTGCQEAFNAFTANETSYLTAVSFYTAADTVDYICRIYDTFDEVLEGLMAEKTGTLAHTGFHTVDLDEAVSLKEGDDFYVYLSLSAGGHPFDRTSRVEVLLGGESGGVEVPSSAGPGQSFYREAGVWKDMQNSDVEYAETANFCIKALAVMSSPSNVPDNHHPAGHRLQGNYPNPFNPFTHIRFELTAATVAELTVMNVTGQTVRQLLSERCEAGIHEVIWDGTDDRGRAVSSGTYLVRFRAGARLQIHKMILLR